MCYLGWGSLAVIGLIDASECDPTFGAGEAATSVFRWLCVIALMIRDEFCCVFCVRETMTTSEASSVEDTES